jgi:1-acyl-sn-glycerol-3-phosphate acyltransferase
MNNLLYTLVIFFVRWIMIVHGFRYSGNRNIPKAGGAIIASNHQSYLDPAILASGSPRHVHFLARQELFEFNWFFKILISSLNAVPLERRKFNSEGLRKTIDYLTEGEVFIVFPEGTRTPDGTIRPFKPGMTTLSLKAGVPIIPARITGAFESWPRTSNFPKRRYPISVTYGEPIIPGKDESPDEICRKLYERVTNLK